MRKKAIERQKEAKRRKNFLPTLLITLSFWGAVIFIIYFVDPSNTLTIPLFIVATFLAFLFTFAIAFANTRRGLFTSLVITTFIVLRYFGVGNLLNFVLLAGIAITAEVFFTKVRG